MRTSSSTRRDFLRTAAVASCLPLLSKIGFASSYLTDEHTAAFRAAKFGMFIHWGPYSLASVEASWPIMVPKDWGISEADYRELPKRFNPTKFDPDAFVDLARSAGQRYMVFTTKHHDGFCMFDSSYTDYKITNTPYGKDIVAQLSTACQKRDMPLGFYYSPPDMHHIGFRDTSKPAKDNWRGEPQRPEWPLYLDYMELQLTELLTRYGQPFLIWFDGLNNQEKYDGIRFLNLIHKLQPATVVNDRLGVDADYETPEQFIPTAIPTKGIKLTGIDPKVSEKLKNTTPSPEEFRLWETCMTINNTWAYNRNDHEYKSSQLLIRSLVEVASRGGNFLLNVGPQPDGTIQPEFQERVRAIGDWLAVNGESIYETTYGPIQGVTAFRTTRKGKSVFVHIFNWTAPTLELPDIKEKILSARLLAGRKPLTFRQEENRLRIDVPSQAPDSDVSVIALRTL